MPRHLGADRRHLPHEWHRADGRRSAYQRCGYDCRSWDIPNLWICDGSVFPTVGGVNPSLTIQALACRMADRIRMAVIARRVMSEQCIAVVTGGSAGVGRATVEAFAQAGWNVGIIARGQRRLDAAVGGRGS